MSRHVSNSELSSQPLKDDLHAPMEDLNPAMAYGSSADAQTDSPHDLKGSPDKTRQNAISEVSMGGSTVSMTEKLQEGDGKVGRESQSAGTINGSQDLSPTNSKAARGQQQGLQQPDDTSDGKADENKKEAVLGKPAWSELKTKAGKERKRLPLACIACRRKKIRCSGEKPACKHCVRSRIPCVYKVTMRKAAPRTDYMTMLDKRLKRMEERVLRIIPGADPDRMASIGRATVKPPAQQPPRSAGTKKRVADEAFTQEVEDWATGDGKSEYVRQAQNNDQAENRLLREGIEFLPSTEIQEHLAETFFDYVYGQSYHLLHKPSFMRRLKAGTAPPVLTLAICAISARFSPHPEFNTEPPFLRGEQWAKPAREIALKRYDEPNITILIVLLILGLHEFGTCQGGRSWMLGGMAMRMAHALQLHRELDHDPLGRKKDKSSELSFTDREIRRRTMWACFLMDRFNSSGTERPMMVSEENIEVQLPIKESNFRMEIPGPTESLDGKVPNPISPNAGQVAEPQMNMGVAAYVVRALAIWGRVIRYMNLGGKQRDPYEMWDSRSHFAELKRQVDEFAEKLPEQLKLSPNNLKNFAAERLANQYLFLHLVHYQTLLFLHRFVIPTTPGQKLPRGLTNEFRNQAMKIAIKTANQISLLLNDSATHMVTAPFAGYCAFTSGTIHVWGIHYDNAHLKVSSGRHLAINIKFLSTMKKYWGIFYHMVDNLRSIYQQHANASRRGPNATIDTVVVDTAVFEYGNWFNTYPHGVSKTDYQEPAVPDSDQPDDDAALGQKSDLQTVEEFFNTLIPPPTSQRKARRPNGSFSLSHSHLPASSITINKGHKIPTHHRLSHRHDPNTPLVSLGPRPGSNHTSDPLDMTNFDAQNIYANQQTPFRSPHASQTSQLQTPNPPQQLTPSSTTEPSPFDPNVFSPAMPVSMTEMDRQFVFDAYAADPNDGGNMMWDFSVGDPTTSASANLDLHSPVPQMGVMGGGGTPSGQSVHGMHSAYGDVSSAWFLPFNLAPPDVSDDGFGGGSVTQKGSFGN